MPADTTIHAFPELRQLAEREARARVVTFAAIEGDDCAPDGDVSTVAAVELRLLCDLSRDASRDAIARLVGERIAWPAWEVAKAEHDWISLWGLHRKVGLPEPEPWGIVPPFSTTLATIVRHLWPQE